MHLTIREYLTDIDLYQGYTARLGSKDGIPVYKIHPHNRLLGATCLVASIVNGHYSHTMCSMNKRLHLTPRDSADF